MSLNWAHPLVSEWFLSKIGQPTEPQRQGWPAILAGHSTLIAAPTGSGKTLAAFLVFIDRLVKAAVDQRLAPQTEVLYVSPLKALSNDIQKNLNQPLEEIYALAQARGIKMEKIKIAVRTGDTPSTERAQMLKKPPHILVTTPESLYILLTAEKSREILTQVKTVIVDEIHALVNNKRGSHLALSLERLQDLTKHKLIRIGLSATQKPIETVANFLTGINNNSEHAKTAIVNIGHRRNMDLAIEVPKIPLGPVASNELWDDIYDRITEHCQNNRSTLIFVNTRRLAERVAHHLRERLGEECVAAHHGSLSRKLRLEAEHKLKEGSLKALVATASLELGIDIGVVDLVCQIGSPRSISVALQRIGRSGHWVGAIPKGRLFATTRDELLELSALNFAIQEGELEALKMPEAPLDILCQQIIASTASRTWTEEELYHSLCSALPYSNLSREVFENMLAMLSEGIAGSRGRYSAYLFRDPINKTIKARRGARMNAIMSGGAIPENGLFRMIAEPEALMVGTLDEDFAIESNRGDIVLLGNTAWRVNRIEAAKAQVIVEDAKGAPPNVPFWRGEAPARSDELSGYVSKLRLKLEELLFNSNEKMTVSLPKTLSWLQENCYLDHNGASQLIEYLQQGRAVLGAVPSQQTIIAERFFDEGGGMQLVIHSPFGARINKAWGMSLRKKFCRSFNFELQAAATDNGLNISLNEQHSFPLQDVFKFLSTDILKDTLEQAILQAPIFETRWRWTATRSLALLRYRAGKKIPPHILRMLSQDLLAAVFPESLACQDNLGGKKIELPDHPLIQETMNDILSDFLDLEGFEKVIGRIQNSEIECLAVDSPLPSVFSMEILNANPYAFLDDAPLEERRARAVELRRQLPTPLLEEIGRLDSQAIREVQHQAWPDLRDPDELQDFLQTVVALPMSCREFSVEREWGIFFEVLLQAGRASIAWFDNQAFWFSVENKNFLSTLYPGMLFEKDLKEFESKKTDPEEILLTVIRGWVGCMGPFTAEELSDILKISGPQLNSVLLRLENSGLILRGKFRSELSAQSDHSEQSESLEWCERRLLARIHRMTIENLRKEIQPLSRSEFMDWLFTWQHLAAKTQLSGEMGLLEVIKQLQGFELPAQAWETVVFPKRLKDYEKSTLDRLCMTGVVGWGRLSVRNPLITEEENSPAKVYPNANTPISFYLREDRAWLKTRPFDSDFNPFPVSYIAERIEQYLKDKGASFMEDLKAGLGHLESELELGIWELIRLGKISADSFGNLRILMGSTAESAGPSKLNFGSRLGRNRNHNRSTRALFRLNVGRWFLTEDNSHTKNILEKDPKSPQHVKKYIEDLYDSEILEKFCWMLLNRYGVVFRDLLAREKILPPWGLLLKIFRRLEDRGEIRGGRFVQGVLGEQFALPYVVPSMRNFRKQIENDRNTNEKDTSRVVEISARDPLNLVGILFKGNRVSSVSKRKLIFINGEPQLEPEIAKA